MSNNQEAGYGSQLFGEIKAENVNINPPPPPPDRKGCNITLSVILSIAFFLIVGGILLIPQTHSAIVAWFQPVTTVVPPVLTGKPIGDVQVFSVIEHYDPSGLMGDIDDIFVSKKDDLISCVYKTQGGTRHEWDWKYVDKKDNPEFARFGGVMLLDPPNNWGIIKDGGYDLQGVETISWEARSIQGDVYVEFLIGGVNWQWNNDTKTRESVPYPDSLPRTSLGVYLLTSEFQSFQYDLSNIPNSYFQKVVGGFGWVISWAPNGVQINDTHTAPIQPKTIEIEVRQIQYKK
jgi:hypothetical protein